MKCCHISWNLKTIAIRTWPSPSITERVATWRFKSRPSARHWWPLLLMEVWKWVTKIVIWANTNVSLTSRFPSFLIIRQSDCFFSSQKRLVRVKTIWPPTPWHLLPGFHHSLPTWLLPHLRVLLASLMQSKNLVLWARLITCHWISPFYLPRTHHHAMILQFRCQIRSNTYNFEPGDATSNFNH